MRYNWGGGWGGAFLHVPLRRRSQAIDMAVRDTPDVQTDMMKFCDDNIDVLVMGSRGLGLVTRCVRPGRRAASALLRSCRRRTAAARGDGDSLPIDSYAVSLSFVWDSDPFLFGGPYGTPDGW